MASSSIPTGVAVKFLGAKSGCSCSSEPYHWTPRLLRVCQERALVCHIAGSAFAEGSGEVAYFPDGDRSWPATFPVLNMKVL